MDNQLVMTNGSAVARGSIADLMRDGGADSLADAFTNVRLILACDRSGSMTARDAGLSGNEPRYSVEDRLVEEIQTRHQGKILLIAFGEKVQPRVNGILPEPSGSTPMLEALTACHRYLASDMRIILISDGEPTDARESEIIEWAKKRLNGQLDTAFTGHKGAPGQQFLRDLAAAVNGQHMVNVLIETKALADRVTMLLGRGET